MDNFKNLKTIVEHDKFKHGSLKITYYEKFSVFFPNELFFVIF